MYKVLSIAGSDCSGGAGIQADLKTIAVHKMYGMSVITALTAQNTMGVYGIQESSKGFVGAQIDAVFTDIQPDAVKIGMVSNEEIIKVIVEKLKQYAPPNVVVDPVMVSTSNSRLIGEASIKTMVDHLFPLARVITPNIPEAEYLSGIRIQSQKDMVKAASLIGELLPGGVLIKGGHMTSDATDLLYEKGEITWFSTERINNSNTHGTGCTLSSAIACNLAANYSLKDSIKNAKDFLTGALKAKLSLGHGSGPLDHTYGL